MILRCLLLTLAMVLTASAQVPGLVSGVSHDLAVWRAARYSDVRYKLDLTLEKMSPVLKGTIEIRVYITALPRGTSFGTGLTPGRPTAGSMTPIILDWRKLPGHEKDSTISNVTINGIAVALNVNSSWPPTGSTQNEYYERNDHLIFRDGVKDAENVIKLDFTSPILTSGSAITRYIDKEDGSEYLYSLFVPSDASTAFPVFDQPDLKARFTVSITKPRSWTVISNTTSSDDPYFDVPDNPESKEPPPQRRLFQTTEPISTYVFAFAAGPWKEFGDPESGSHYVAEAQKEKYKKWLQNDVSIALTADQAKEWRAQDAERPKAEAERKAAQGDFTHIYVRKSQAAKFQPHAAETFRLTREAVKYLETYFDYKFPWPKYDLVLIPEFPFGGMEHAGATSLKESSVIFPSEPTKGDYISRANVIFHETAHQWFGDLVTMRWFDDLWLKEGFAEFMAYKTLEHVMPAANAWKVFYERNKQAAYATDSTRGTTPIYQPIANLSAAKSAYGNIVYRKAPSFLRQAEFYLGEDKFQTAVRAFLKKHEYANAGWEDLVTEFQAASGKDLQAWAHFWVTTPGLFKIRTHGGFTPIDTIGTRKFLVTTRYDHTFDANAAKVFQVMTFNVLAQDVSGKRQVRDVKLHPFLSDNWPADVPGFDTEQSFVFPNYGDYGYGIFLLDDRSRDYVLKHIGEEKDPFLRSTMWGALWDSVREAELDPREYVELVIKQLGGGNAQARASISGVANGGARETDETTIQSLLGRVSVALNYYLPGSDTALPHGRASVTDNLRSQLEAILLDRMQHAETPGLRVTFYRAFVANASTEHGREVLKSMLKSEQPPASAGGTTPAANATSGPASKRGTAAAVVPPAHAGGSDLHLRTKDKFDIVTRLIVLGDPDAPKLLAELERTETSDDAKRYAYAAHAAFATAGNRAKFWNDFVNNKDISESWIEAAIGPFNSIRHPELSQPYLERALAELPNLKRTRKIFFVNNWLGAWLSGQNSEQALDIVNKFLTDHPQLDTDLRLKILENVDVIERAVKIRRKFGAG